MINERNVQLDMVRCVALFLIVLCHTQVGLNDVSPIIVKFKWFIGKCGVPLFLIISGYLNLPMKYGDKEFLARRFSRVFFPFLFWCVIYRILYMMYNGSLFIGLRESEDFFMIASSAHLWYIYAILAIYLITPIISGYFELCSKKMFQLYLLIWIISSVFPYYYQLTGQRFFDHNVTYITYYLGGYLGYYLFGYYIKRFQPQLIVGKWSLHKCFFHIGLGLFGIAFIYAGFYILNMTTVEFSSYVSIVPILFSTIAISILWRIHVVSRNITNIIKSLAKYSFGVYLIHEIVIIYVFPLILGESNSWELNGIIILFLNITLALFNIVISYAMVRLLSLLPKSKFLLG